MAYRRGGELLSTLYLYAVTFRGMHSCLEPDVALEDYHLLYSQVRETMDHLAHIYAHGTRLRAGVSKISTGVSKIKPVIYVFNCSTVQLCIAAATFVPSVTTSPRESKTSAGECSVGRTMIRFLPHISKVLPPGHLP